MRIETFYALSVPLTGFMEVELKGTGAGPTYFAQLQMAVGDEVLEALALKWEAVRLASKGDAQALKEGLRKEILSDAMLGPVARNIIKLWYLATWYPLPDDWTERYVDSTANAGPRILSPQVYKEGLTWKAIGRHPMGAKWPGYGSWELKPDALDGIF